MNKFSKFVESRHYSLSLIGAGLMLLALLLMLFILDFVGNDLVSIHVFVQELDESNVGGYFTFQVKSIIKIILLGPVHSLICYFLIRPLIIIYMNTTSIEKTNAEFNNRKWVWLLDCILVLFLMINNTGHVIHWICDRANKLYTISSGGYNIDPAFLLIYATDEYLGHAFAHISYFVFLMLFAILEILQNKEHIPKWDEWILIVLIAVGIGVVNGYAARLSESAFLLLLLSICGIIFTGIVCVKKKILLSRSPMVLAFMLGCVFVIIYDLIFVITNGLLPYYPFIT